MKKEHLSNLADLLFTLKIDLQSLADYMENHSGRILDDFDAEYMADLMDLMTIVSDALRWVGDKGNEG